MRKINGYYVLDSYYRSQIDMDTSLDVRHLISVLTSFFPDIKIDFGENVCILVNVRNHMHQKIVITWRHTI